MLVRRTTPVPIECVARGYLSGSGWKEYRQRRPVCGIPLPPGLREGDRLPEPIFTPATKAESGHDENIPESRAGEIVGADRRRARCATCTLALYAPGGRARRDARHHPRRHEVRVRLARRTGTSDLILIDEALTPDSSRFWPADTLGARRPAAELRQAVRARLPRDDPAGTSSRPVPSLPDDVVRRTRDKYLEAYRRLTGREL